MKLKLHVIVPAMHLSVFSLGRTRKPKRVGMISKEKVPRKRKNRRPSLTTDKDKRYNKTNNTTRLRQIRDHESKYKTQFDKHILCSRINVDAELNQCIICRDDIILQTASTLPCGHVFCQACIEYW